MANPGRVPMYLIEVQTDWFSLTSLTSSPRVTSAVPATTTQCSDRCRWLCRDRTPPGFTMIRFTWNRSEHWVVVAGTAEVTLGEEVKLVSENQSVYIPLGTHHRMANPGRVPMYLIEVQTGAYLGEDDIIRYEDVYGRG